MADAIVVLILVLVLGLAIRYIIIQKKQGKCIGCPSASSCSKKSCSNIDFDEIRREIHR